MSDSCKYRAPLLLLGVMALLPALQTCVSVYLEWHTVVTYPLLKILMVLLPVFVWMKTGMNRSEICAEIGLKKTRLLSGIVIGSAMGAGIILGFKLSGIGTIIDTDLLVDKLAALGLTEYYWVLAVGISFWNALFEEYYWRGFLVGKLRLVTSNNWLVILSGGLFFGLHHIFALLFIGNPMLVILGVSTTILAGIIWTAMRIRGISLIDCYVSHVIADMAIFYVGYLILKA